MLGEEDVEGSLRSRLSSVIFCIKGALDLVALFVEVDTLELAGAYTPVESMLGISGVGEYTEAPPLAVHLLQVAVPLVSLFS